MTITSSQYNQLVPKLKEILGSLLGVNSSQIDIHTHFVEMGVESLFLLQFSRSIEEKFDIKIPFRLLLEEFSTIDALANHIAQQMPTIEAATEELTPTEPLQELTLQQLSVKTADVRSPNEEAVKPVVERLIAQQLQVMSKQLELLHKGSSTNKVSASSNILQSAAIQQNILEKTSNHTPLTQSKNLSKNNQVEYARKSVSATVRQAKKDTLDGLNSHQKQHLDSLIARISKRTQESKRLTQSARTCLANPRSITGFRPSIKEMLYPIHAQRGVDGRIWDVDGNEYIDISMGFGALLFGHSPSFVTEAIQEYIKHGIQHGPQSRLTGQVAELICELTGQERATFCNSGTDAVMGSIRIARAVTGRSKIAMFAGSYHGTLDEVLVTGIANQDGTLRTVPVAPGIPQHMAEKVIALDYGNPQSLDIIAANAHELAAVLVEPLQSRQPDLHPKEFLQKLRQLTQEKGIVLIFDEVITGFRMHPGGIQALWDIQADLITYGKSVGGGLPIGVVAGKAAFMDALDGGFWSYGDASYPEAETTVFAGTFFKHPLVMAVALAVLNHIKERGPKLQEELAKKTAKLAKNLNSYFQEKQLPIKIDYFGSLFIFNYPPHLTWMNLLFYYLLEKGVYVWEGRTCFLSTAHTDEDIEQVIRAVKESIEKMQAAEFLPATKLSLNLVNEPDTKSLSTFPLTAQQQELWVMAQMGVEGSRAYNESTIIHVRGLFNVSAMRQAIQEIINRHEALRTTFSTAGDYQLIHSTLTIDIPLIDFSSSNSNQSEALLTEWLAREAQQNFDLEQGPLLRTQIIKLEEQHHLIVLTNHHIIADGWSVGVLMQELSVIYSATCQGDNYQLPQPTQYSEYAQWQAHQLHSPEMTTAEAYWLKQFAGYVPVLELPTDYPRPLINKFIGDQKNIIIDRKLKNKLTSLSSEGGCTLFTTLLAAYMVLIHRLTGQEDIVIGIPAAGQLALDSECLVGHCVNLLPLRSQIFSDPVFTDYLKLVKKVLLDAYDYQAYPFIKLIKSLNLPRDSSRNPLITAIFNLEKAEAEPEFWGGKIQVDANATGTAKFDISLNIIQTDHELLLECSYNTDLFAGQTIERWLGHYVTLLNDIVINSKYQVSKLQLLTQTERQQLLIDWNQTITNYSLDKCIHQLFEEQVERTPDAVAVVFENQQLTYQELNQRANQLAHHLQKLGVGSEVLVGICIERTLNMVIGLLAILKAGGAYVPLDPAYPQERLAFILQDAQVTVLLTQQQLLKTLPQHQAQVICIDSDWQTIAQHSQENLATTATANTLAYVIYTSGSTGRPKGVAIEHHSTVALLDWAKKQFILEELAGVLASTSICFDLSVFELFVPLSCGGQVILAENALALPTLSTAQQVSLINTVPSAIAQLLKIDGIPTSVRIVNLAGEPLQNSLVQQIYQRTSVEKVFNLYGPSEDTTYSTFALIDKQSSKTPPIGRPIANTQIYLLNERLQPVPVGVPGELYISGDGLARGYLNRTELTAEKFIANPFDQAQGSRLYKTGDLARYHSDGNIEFLGRIDHQVKVRGFRIELGEIEAALTQHPVVEQVVVVAREDEPGEKRLVAYLVAKEQPAPSTSELRHFLSEKLPEYIIPAAFMQLEALPLTPNGKLDRKALPAPDTARPELDKAFVAPRTFVEAKLAKIWAEVLHVDQVGIHDNFFELGGDSIITIQIIAKANQAGLQLTSKQLFQHQNIADLATVCVASGAIQAEQGLVTGAVPLIPIQQWFFEQDSPEPHHFNQAVLLEVPMLDVNLLKQALQHLVLHHDALRSHFELTESGWQQFITSSEPEVPITCWDFSTLAEVAQAEAMEVAATELQASFNLSAGSLVRVALFDLGVYKRCRLLIVIHHLVVDGVSWRILLEDLQTAYKQLSKGEAVSISSKTTSVKRWATSLQEYAHSATLKQEWNYWLTELQKPVSYLQADYPEGENTEESAETVSIALGVEQTQALLHEVPKAYNTQINDVLLTALVQAFAETWGDVCLEQFRSAEAAAPTFRYDGLRLRSLLVNLEGHGREEIFPDVDLSRTVGWFTTIFPVVLNVGEAADSGAALKAVKEQLRSIPNRGIGYGMLRYLSNDTEIIETLKTLPQAEIIFNYLGQFDQTFSDSSLFSFANESSGRSHSLQGRRSHLLEINSLVSGGQLQIALTYSKNLYRKTTVEFLMQNFVTALGKLITHCQSSESGGYTPSDFPDVELSQTQLEKALAEMEIG